MERNQESNLEFAYSRERGDDENEMVSWLYYFNVKLMTYCFRLTRSSARWTEAISKGAMIFPITRASLALKFRRIRTSTLPGAAKTLFAMWSFLSEASVERNEWEIKRYFEFVVNDVFQPSFYLGSQAHAGRGIAEADAKPSGKQIKVFKLNYF